MNKRDVNVVVETRGGTTVAIYTDDPNTRVVLVDWDELHDSERPGVVYPTDSLTHLPSDTRDLVDRALLLR